MTRSGIGTVLTLFAICLCLASTSVLAMSWQVDLLIFRHLESDSEIGHAAHTPATSGRIIAADNAVALQDAGIRILPDSEFGLQDKWGYLRRSRQFRPLVKMSWIQADPPARGGPGIRIQSGEKVLINGPDGLFAQELFEIDGTVRLNLGRYLHFETDLVYTQTEGVPLSWALKEGRRMRSNELHHLDSAKLGALIQVRRLSSNGAPP